MTAPWTASPPPPPLAPPPRPPRTGAPRWAVALIAAVAALVVAAGVFVALTLTSGTANANEVTREPVNTAGANPFMPTVGTDAPGVASPTTTGGTFTGDTPGLYGGTRDNRTCDAAKLTGFLNAHPSQAAAWAGVLNISTTQIDSYVSSLTPVLLRSDTQVTNHGYVDGRATVVSSVLQAGSAVFVDKYGSPVVRCACGNPLTAPTLLTAPVYIGQSWVTFDQTNITVVQNTTNVVNDYTLVDPWKQQTFVRTGGYEPGWKPKRDDGGYGPPPSGGTTTPGGTGTPGGGTGTTPPDGSGGTPPAGTGPGTPGGTTKDPIEQATCPDGSKAGASRATTSGTADLSGTGGRDAAVLVTCGDDTQVQVIDPTGAMLDTVTPEAVPNSPQLPEFRSASLSGNTLTATVAVYGAEDTATPTGTQTWTYTWSGSSFTLDPGSVEPVEIAPTTESSEPVAPNLVAPDTGTSTSSTPPSTTTTTTTGSAGG